MTDHHFIGTPEGPVPIRFEDRPLSCVEIGCLIAFGAFVLAAYAAYFMVWVWGLGWLVRLIGGAM